MKKILLAGLLLPYMLFGFDQDMCAINMGERIFDAKPHKNCVIDNHLKNWIECRDYYKNNMLNGLNRNGEKEVAVNPTFYYDYFSDRIREVLLAEIKNVVDRHQGIMCTENSESKLLEYQESIAEHEWCYADKFLKAFDDEDMSEHEMKYDHFVNLYNMRSAVLEGKQKPKNKEILCGVYLECMSSFIHADHTQVSSGLLELYEKTKKECIPAYTIELIRIKEITKNGINRGLKATAPEVISLKEISKRVIFINPKKGRIKNVPLNSGNYSIKTGYKQAYDDKNCKVYLKAIDKKEDSELNRAVVRVASSTPNKRFSANTRLIFEIMDVEPMIDMDWYDFLDSDLNINKKGTYVKTNTSSKTIYGDQKKYAAMRAVVKRAGEAHLDTRCNIDDAKEFARGYWWQMPAYKLSYNYDMDIRPATKSEIREAELFLKNMEDNLKDRQLYRTLNNGNLLTDWKKRPENQEKLKEAMDREMDLYTD